MGRTLPLQTGKSDSTFFSRFISVTNAMLNLARLRLLVELERRGTMAAVASELGYTPSAISQQLALLEREARRALTEKAGRGLRLTRAGRLLAERGRELIAHAESVEADLAALE